MPAEISDRVALASQLVAQDEQSYLDRFPDPYVCRRCGSITGTVPPPHCDRCGAPALTFQRFAPYYWLRLTSSAEVLPRI